MSAEHLALVLSDAGIDITAWGCGDAKSVHDLFHEVTSGEATLNFDASSSEQADGQLRVHREINLVKVRITKQGSQMEALVEARQVFADGRERSRGLPLSEKMRASEEPLAAARRGILEELRSTLAHGSGGVLLKPETLHVYEESRASSSYPFLPTLYRIHRVDAVVADLPDSGFSSIEYGEGGSRLSDSILVHCWEWRRTADVFDS